MTAVKAYSYATSGKSGVILCAREFMNSLEESSMEEVKQAIRGVPWLNAFFRYWRKIHSHQGSPD
uniref:Phage terminase large subunit n=1 Tax=Yersinia pestis TaxID=632 RepID=A0A0K1H0J3_YERPE|nr:Phage terminase large subunit [Yersinia pestis]